MRKWEEVRDELHAESPELKAAYEALGPRFEAINALIRTRARDDMSQSELARRMNVHANVISRLESGAHSPRLDTIAEYARALGYDLKIRLVKHQSAQARPSPRTRDKSRTQRASTNVGGVKSVRAARTKRRNITARRTSARTR